MIEDIPIGPLGNILNFAGLTPRYARVNMAFSEATHEIAEDIRMYMNDTYPGWNFTHNGTIVFNANRAALGNDWDALLLMFRNAYFHEKKKAIERILVIAHVFTRQDIVVKLIDTYDPYGKYGTMHILVYYAYILHKRNRRSLLHEALRIGTMTIEYPFTRDMLRHIGVITDVRVNPTVKALATENVGDDVPLNHRRILAIMNPYAGGPETMYQIAARLIRYNERNADLIMWILLTGHGYTHEMIDAIADTLGRDDLRLTLAVPSNGPTIWTSPILLHELPDLWDRDAILSNMDESIPEAVRLAVELAMK